MPPSLTTTKPTMIVDVGWGKYRVYGLTVSSDFRFASRLAQGTGAPDLTVTCVQDAPLSDHWVRDAPAYASPHRTEDGESRLYVHRLAACDVLRLTGIADFYLWPKRIVCHLLNRLSKDMIEVPLLGVVLPFWLETRGIPALHASATAVNGRAVAFLSSKEGGKSALVAALMQVGYPLLTDDVLPIERSQDQFLGRPGYPTMRMWPDEAHHFLGHYDDLELVHPARSKRRVPVGCGGFGGFCDQPKPLACIYLPERRSPDEGGIEIEITPVSPRDAVIDLVRLSFVAHIVEALRWQPHRMDLFAQLVQKVPAYRFAYPSGFEHLPRVREAILGNLLRTS